MRSFAVRASVLAVLGVVLAAPAASAAPATEYRFVSSTGVTCTLVNGHTTTPQADGRWTIGLVTKAKCDGQVWRIDLTTQVNNTWWGFGSSAICVAPIPGAHRPCGDWWVDASRSMPDGPSGTYTHSTNVRIDLPPPGPQDPPPAWLVVPPGCLPNVGTVTCGVTDAFDTQVPL